MSHLDHLKKLLSMLDVALSPAIGPDGENCPAPNSQKYFFYAKNVIRGLTHDADVLVDSPE